MNILVVVGLFLVGLVAIVVVVLLVGSERGSEIAAADAMTAGIATPPAAPSIVTNADASTKRLTVPLHIPETDPGNTRTMPSADQSWSALAEERLLIAHEEASYAALHDNELRELIAELHSLHMRTGEMQRRLGVLLEMVGRLERDYDSSLDFSDAAISPDIPPGR